MPGLVNTPQVVRFGVFEVDLRAGELRKKGVKLRLQEQPLRVLAVLLDQRGDIVTREELDQLSSQDAIDQRFNAEMTHSLDRWLDMADGKLRGGAIPCILNGGNDDIFEIDPILESAPSVTFAEGKVIDLAGTGFTMISMGYTNPTPWDTHREAPEEELAARIDAVAARVPDMNRTVFNFHAPPYGTGLDEAPELDASMRPTHGGAVMKPVGSTAVRDAILKYQPSLSVHGHIHESRGVAKLGRTRTVNPGSSYGDGVLQAALLDINPKNGKIKYVLVNG